MRHDIASLRQFGVGLAIAVVIDATLVRLVMLPAALLVAGEWTWVAPHLHHEDAPHRHHVATAPRVTPAPSFD